MSPFRGCSLSPSKPSGNPDPSRWGLLRVLTVGHATAVEVRYFDCTNMGGRKIMVFKGRPKAIDEGGFLDPHFSGKKDSPVARFAPTEEGWREAVEYTCRLDIIVCGEVP